ncbi:hypothetical protein ES703_95459 [subsurface metagenome]
MDSRSSPEPCGVWGRGLPQELRAERRRLQGIRLPPGYRFFPDRERETCSRLIEWQMSAGNPESWFATLTFKDYTSEYRAGKMLERWTGQMSEAVYARCRRLKESRDANDLRWIAATEWQKRDVIHFHLVLTANDLADLSRKRWEGRWEKRGGGICRLYDADDHLAPYLSKYLNKSRGGELRWGGTWRGITPPASIDPGPQGSWSEGT